MSLNNYYRAMKKIGRKWKINVIPLATLKAGMHTIRPTQELNKAIPDFGRDYNKLLDTIMRVFSERKKATGLNGVELPFIKQTIERVKSSYRKGMMES